MAQTEDLEVDGLVIREVTTGESDKVITLLTAKYGRITITGKSTLGEILPLLHPEIREKSAHNPMDRTVTFGTITITEGRNRQIRRMMKAVRCLVLGLKRVSMGEILLDESLAPGQWKEIWI